MIFYVGRLVYEKGVDTLLHAFRLLLDSYPTATLVIAGSGPEEDALRRLASELGIPGRVRFLGYVSDEERDDLYRSADAAVFPSRYEPFGIVALEAMAYGAPVVAGRTGGLAEFIEDGKTGVLFPPGDFGALADRLKQLLGSPSQANAMRVRARRMVESTYDWRAIATQTIAVYDEVVREAHPGSPGSRLQHQLEGATTSL